jgi:hypothetical protein
MKAEQVPRSVDCAGDWAIERQPAMGPSALAAAAGTGPRPARSLRMLDAEPPALRRVSVKSVAPGKDGSRISLWITPSDGAVPARVASVAVTETLTAANW